MQKRNILVTTLIIAAVLLVGGLMFWSTQNKSPQVPEMIPNQETSIGSEEQMMPNSGMYQGQKIAGTTSPYLAFAQVDYEKARSEGKVIFLDFYANWCPICRAESPEIIAGFNELTTDQVVGFRVNYKDDETDPDEAALAEQFDIPYQHTKVILVNGQEVSRSGDSWNKERFLMEINDLL